MRHSTKLFAITALCAATFAMGITGCKKDDNDNNAAKDYTFDLQFGSPIVPANVVFYNNQQDYYKKENAVASGKTDASGKLVIPASKLTKLNTYFVDIYSDDYGYSNWGKTSDIIQSFVYGDNNSSTNYSYSKTLPSPSYGRAWFYLYGGALETNWKAVAARTPHNGGTSTDEWDNISARDQLKSLKFRRDFTGVYTTKDSLLNDVNTNFNYNPALQVQAGSLLQSNASGDTIILIDNNTAGIRFYFKRQP